MQALGNLKVAALPGLHALSGADITGSLGGKGKATWWKLFKEADEETLNALANIGTRDQPTAITFAGIEKFVCQLYAANTTIVDVSKLRWWPFRKKQAQSERLPPTKEVLRQAIIRANFQALVWPLDIEQQLPSPETFGWKLDGDKWVPMMTKLPPAPDAVVELVRCECTKSKCSSNTCSCRNANLNCMDLSRYSDVDDDDSEDLSYESDDSDSDS